MTKHQGEISSLREQLRELERQRDEYAWVVSEMLEAAAALRTGTVAGVAKALVARRLLGRGEPKRDAAIRTRSGQ